LACRVTWRRGGPSTTHKTLYVRPWESWKPHLILHQMTKKPRKKEKQNTNDNQTSRLLTPSRVRPMTTALWARLRIWCDWRIPTVPTLTDIRIGLARRERWDRRCYRKSGRLGGCFCKRRSWQLQDRRRGLLNLRLYRNADSRSAFAFSGLASRVIGGLDSMPTAGTMKPDHKSLKEHRKFEWLNTKSSTRPRSSACRS
jgi:hypothetical protein